MVKAQKQQLTFLAPILYLFAIFAISMHYFNSQSQEVESSNSISLNAIMRKSDIIRKASIKEIKIEATGSMFLFNWKHKPALLADDGVKHSLIIESYEQISNGYIINFSHNISLVFIGTDGALTLAVQIPQELKGSVKALTIPWQALKGFSIDANSEVVSQLSSDEHEYYLQYSKDSVIIEPIKKRMTFVNFNDAIVTFSSNSYGEAKTFEEFISQNSLVTASEEESYFNRVIDLQYQLLLSRLQEGSALFVDINGQPRYNEEAIALLLAFADAKNDLEGTLKLFGPEFFEKNPQATALLAPYYGYKTDIDQSTIDERIAHIRELIRNDDNTVFASLDLFNFTTEHGYYTARAQLVNLASMIDENEEMLLTAQKLYFITTALNETPRRERRADELQLANRLVRRLLMQVTWLKSDLYLYDDKEISFYGALLASHSFEIIAQERLLARSDLDSLKTISFYLRRGAFDVMTSKGYFPYSLFWDGSIASSDTRFIAIEELGSIIWPNLLYPKNYSQRRFLNPGMNVNTLAPSMRSSFFDREKRIIQLDFTLAGPAYQYSIVSDLPNVVRVISKGEELPMVSSPTAGRESWYYDATSNKLYLYLEQTEDELVRYRIFLEPLRQAAVSNQSSARAATQPSARGTAEAAPAPASPAAVAPADDDKNKKKRKRGD